MRGTPERQVPIFHTFNVEDLIEPDHPLRAIKRMVDRALSDMSRTFNAAYSDTGRPGVPPETLLKALLLQCLYTVRSERELCRRLKTDLLFRWFLDLRPSDEVFDHAVFSHNRERLAEHGITPKFFDTVVKQALALGLTSDEHFTVDGTLIQSHASLKSLKRIEREERRKDDDPPSGGRNASVDFKGEKRANATHRSTTDPEARLYKKGDGVGAFLCHSAHALSENRHGLIVAVRVEEANGTAERASALRMLDHAERGHGVRPWTLGADKGYDAGPFLVELEKRWIEPHIAIKSGRIDPMSERSDQGTWARWFVRQEQRRAGFRTSQRRRKLVEEFFGWVKTVAGLRRARHVGREKITQCFELAAAAYNLVRMRTLTAA
ncbi:MAG: IS5 family transposase [Phycisphaeraceae bacterium]|nr:IS5 family transposase [Phycisphaerales bacterium]QOJ16352.1 MAG: IS5 family transposase [Phycisphaeraceae bacterium]